MKDEFEGLGVSDLGWSNETPKNGWEAVIALVESTSTSLGSSLQDIPFPVFGFPFFEMIQKTAYGPLGVTKRDPSLPTGGDTQTEMTWNGKVRKRIGFWGGGLFLPRLRDDLLVVART